MLVARAIGRRAKRGSPEAYKVIADRTEGKPQQSLSIVTAHDDLGPVLSQLNRGELRHYCETGELPQRLREEGETDAKQ
jgi:hypothetical protein